MANRIRTLIMGAAGRDFHNFLTYFKDNETYEVIAYTATQIPGIEGRQFPGSMSGSLYPEGIPILDENDLSQIITPIIDNRHLIVQNSSIITYFFNKYIQDQ